MLVDGGVTCVLVFVLHTYLWSHHKLVRWSILSLYVCICLQVAEKINEHIWAPVDPKQLEELPDGKCAVLKQALHIFLEKDVDKMTKLMVAMAECKYCYVLFKDNYDVWK